MGLVVFWCMLKSVYVRGEEGTYSIYLFCFICSLENTFPPKASAIRILTVECDQLFQTQDNQEIQTKSCFTIWNNFNCVIHNFIAVLHFICQSSLIFFFTYLCINLSIYLLIYLFIHLFIYLLHFDFFFKVRNVFKVRCHIA